MKFSCTRFLIAATLVAGIGLYSQTAFGLGEKQHVTFTPAADSFPLVHGGIAAPLYTSSDEWVGVLHAVTNFSADVNAVTGVTPTTLQSTQPREQDVVLIGTVGHSALIDKLIAEHKLNVDQIRGHWEMSVTKIVAEPFPGIHSALVIAGADKRGTIFGIYDLSEQIGRSPWAWWADVPVPHHSDLYVTPGTYVQPEPAVKYRGIFLNDEAPALSGWTQEKFGGFNHEFYTHVFDLLLRLKANFLWPAMWSSAFAADDPLSPKLADEYGIVMGTSHEEPMMRAEKEWTTRNAGPWNYVTNSKAIDEFWRTGMERDKDYENVVTLGMRGDGDTPMSTGTNIDLLEKIVADQRKILKQTVNPDLNKVPQVWALYKEVQTYYEKGMRVPDDVTLLWSDDNWGNLRRLPTPEERKRSGGAGIYYHFDYVGGPRSYKWLNTYSITKVWEQMNLAVKYGADRIWVVNVGDLKPMEFPIEFFLSMARTPDRWGKDNLQEYTQLWAAREFGPEHAAEIADLVATYTKYNSRRKPEQLDPTTYSLTIDHEADRIDAEWHALAERGEHVNAELPADARPAFFELVLYPIEACATVGEMYTDAGRNQLYAKQGRTSANQYADETRTLFTKDGAFSYSYNHLLKGKWDHMMDQTHIGYTYWNEPPVNAMPGVQLTQPLSGAHMKVFVEGPDPSAKVLPVFDSANRQTRSIDITNRGSATFEYTAQASAPWIHISDPKGVVTTYRQIEISIDWDHVPDLDNQGTVKLTHDGEAGDGAATISIRARRIKDQAAVKGFVEDDGTVTIDAQHATANRSANGVEWQVIPGFGETLSGMEAFPVPAPSTPDAGNQACLDYSFYLFDAGARNLQAILAPTLDFMPGHGLRYSIAVDSLPAVTVDAWASNTQADWAQAVSDGVHKVSTPLGDLTAGEHTLHFCRVDAGVVLERLLLSQGNPPDTYLGPPESALLPIAPEANPKTTATAPGAGN